MNIAEMLMDATVGQVVGVIAGIIAIITAIVEFNKKIKKFPITAVLNWIGERTNKNVVGRIDELDQQVKAISKRQTDMESISDERAAIACRVRILRFSDELRRGIDHSQESFEQTIADIDTYDAYCKAHPGFKNNKTVVANERILSSYKHCHEKNNFL